MNFRKEQPLFPVQPGVTEPTRRLGESLGAYLERVAPVLRERGLGQLVVGGFSDSLQRRFGASNFFLAETIRLGGGDQKERFVARSDVWDRRREWGSLVDGEEVWEGQEEKRVMVFSWPPRRRR